MLKTCIGHVSLHMLYSNNWVFTSKVAWGKGVCIIHVETQGICQALEIGEFSIYYTEFPLVAYDYSFNQPLSLFQTILLYRYTFLPLLQ